MVINALNSISFLQSTFVRLHKTRTNHLLEDQEISLDVALMAVKIPHLSRLASVEYCRGEAISLGPQFLGVGPLQ